MALATPVIDLDLLIEQTRNANHVPFESIPSVEGATFHLCG